MQGVLEWARLLCHRYLMDYDDDVICILVYIVLIYAFVFYICFLYTSNYILKLCASLKYLYK